MVFQALGGDFLHAGVAAQGAFDGVRLQRGYLNQAQHPILTRALQPPNGPTTQRRI